jgi:hypothetical protein
MVLISRFSDCEYERACVYPCQYVFVCKMISNTPVNGVCFKSSLKLFDQFLRPWNYFSLLGSNGCMMQFHVEHFALWQCIDYFCSTWPLVGYVCFSSLHWSLHFYNLYTRTLLKMVCDVSCFIILLRKDAHFHVIGHYHHIACRVLGLVVSSSLINSQEVFREVV